MVPISDHLRHSSSAEPDPIADRQQGPADGQHRASRALASGAKQFAKDLPITRPELGGARATFDLQRGR